MFKQRTPQSDRFIKDSLMIIVRDVIVVKHLELDKGALFHVVVCVPWIKDHVDKALPLDVSQLGEDLRQRVLLDVLEAGVHLFLVVDDHVFLVKDHDTILLDLLPLVPVCALDTSDLHLELLEFI